MSDTHPSMKLPVAFALISMLREARSANSDSASFFLLPLWLLLQRRLRDQLFVCFRRGYSVGMSGQLLEQMTLP